MRYAFERIVLGSSLLAFALSVFGIPAKAADLPTNIYISICGDGIIQTGEVCDQGTGNNTAAYGSSTVQRVCAPGCLSFGPYCGDGILQVRFGEQCDDSNNTSGDLCSASCKSETAVVPSASDPHGSIPSQSAPPGTIPSALATQVVLRGKAYPNASVDILLDGKSFDSTRADSNADFLYTSTAVTPGTATFSFLAHDTSGVDSLMSSATFSIIQSAVTTVNNIFIPPTISASVLKLSPGDLLTLFGQSVPGAAVSTQLSASVSSLLTARADPSGKWALQVDTSSLSLGDHAAKSYFQTSTTTKSGFGKAVNFSVGGGTGACNNASDINGDKKVNLVDFSIFLTHWGTSDAAGDLNCNGTVNLADFSIMLFNWTG
jgi:cysteine-rich repeat protein